MKSTTWMVSQCLFSLVGFKANIGRNDKVTITKGSESKSVKYKKAVTLLDAGWNLSTH